MILPEKTLATLDLSSNQIGAEGASSLADALQENTVTLVQASPNSAQLNLSVCST